MGECANCKCQQPKLSKKELKQRVKHAELDLEYQAHLVVYYVHAAVEAGRLRKHTDILEALKAYNDAEEAYQKAFEDEWTALYE